MTTDGLKSLLRSRKVLLALLGIVQTLVLAYLQVKPEVWAAIDALLLVLIDGISKEDAAQKSAGTNQAISGGTVNVTNPSAAPVDSERKTNGDLRSLAGMDTPPVGPQS